MPQNKGLNQYIRTEHPQLWLPVVDLEEYRGKKFAIDVSNYMYKFAFHGQKSSPSDNFFSNHTENKEQFDFLKSFIRQYERLQQFDIKVIYVFDGTPSPLKQDEINSRRALKEKKTQQIQNIDNIIDTLTIQICELDTHKNRLEQNTVINEVQLLQINKEREQLVQQLANCEKQLEKQKQGCISLSKEHYEALQNLFDHHNIDYIVPKDGDAERLCAFLSRKGIVDVVVSNDIDTIVFGANILLRNLFSGNQQQYPTQRIRYTDLLQTLEMSRPQFVDFFLLSGSDLCKHLKGIGPKTAYKFIKKYGSIKKFLSSKEGKKRIKQKSKRKQLRRNFKAAQLEINSAFQCDENGMSVCPTTIIKCHQNHFKCE